MHHVGLTAAVGGNRGGLDQFSTQFGAGNRRLLAHALGRGLQHEENGAQVDGQRAVPLLRRELEHSAGFGDPRVVEQHVQASPAPVGQLEYAIDIRRTCNVRLDGSLAEFIGQRLRRLTVEIRQQQLRAFTGHAARARGADAARGAGDERMNAVQPTGHVRRAAL
jgi:hypothetical protein